MNIHKRTIMNDEGEVSEIEYFGINSKGTFTIILQGGLIINFSDEEFRKLQKFVRRIE